MSDLIGRLRGLAACEHDDHAIGAEAAEELAALKAENERLRAALTRTALAAAWKRYCELFGEEPHGTIKQMGALLELAGIRQAAPEPEKEAQP